MNHVSDLIMIIKWSTHIPTIITREAGKLKTHSPISYIKDNCQVLFMSVVVVPWNIFSSCNRPISALDKYLTMDHFVKEMCTYVIIIRKYKSIIIIYVESGYNKIRCNATMTNTTLINNIFTNCCSSIANTLQCIIYTDGSDHFLLAHDDVIKWKHFPHYWPFVRGIHRSPVNSPHKGQWRGALMFSLMCAYS